MTLSFRLHRSMAASAAAMLLCASPVDARQSLGERVTALEAQIATQDTQEITDLRNTVSDLLFRINDLQQEVRDLRGQVENQTFEMERLRDSQREQFLDLDNRLNELANIPDARQPGYAAGNNAGRPVIGRPGVGPATAPGTILPPEVRETTEPQIFTSTLDTSLPDAPTVRVDPETEKRAYELAFDALKQGRYSESARLFNSFIRQFPNGDYADNAQYWLGESYYVTGNHKIAMEAFKALIAQFPSSSKLPDAKLKLGFTFYELQQWGDAEVLLKDVIDNYPGTTVARLAQNRLNAMRIEGHIQ